MVGNQEWRISILAYLVVVVSSGSGSRRDDFRVDRYLGYLLKGCLEKEINLQNGTVQVLQRKPHNSQVIVQSMVAALGIWIMMVEYR